MRRRIGDDVGAAGSLEMILGIGLILVPAVALAAVIPTWIEARSTAQLVAQEAARAAVLQGGEGAFETGAAVGASIASDYGIDARRLSISFDGSPMPGESVKAEVILELEDVWILGFGVLGIGSLTVAHTERVDDYRSVSG